MIICQANDTCVNRYSVNSHMILVLIRYSMISICITSVLILHISLSVARYLSSPAQLRSDNEADDEEFESVSQVNGPVREW